MTTTSRDETWAILRFAHALVTDQDEAAKIDGTDYFSVQCSLLKRVLASQFAHFSPEVQVTHTRKTTGAHP